MKRITFKNLSVLFFVAAGATIISSCKKTGSSPTSGLTPVDSTSALSDADSLKYLMYNTMQVSFLDGGRDTVDIVPTYYWYTNVPKLNPLSSTYDSADVLLQKMKTYAINPSTGRPFDKYSFLDHGQVAGEIQQGVAGDIGMQVTYAGDGTASNTRLFVLFTDKNSP